MALQLAAVRELLKAVGSIPAFNGNDPQAGDPAAVTGPRIGVSEFCAKVGNLWGPCGVDPDSIAGVRVCSTRLEGTAFSWFASLGEEDGDLPPGRAAFFAALRARFAAPDASPVSMLALVQLAPAASLSAIAEFNSRFQAAQLRIPDFVLSPSVEGLLLAMYVSKMPPEVAQEMRMRPPASVTLAMPIAVALAAAARMRTESRPAAAAAPKMAGLHAIGGMRGRPPPAWDAERIRRYEAGACFKCGELGHVSKDCNKKSQYVVASVPVPVSIFQPVVALPPPPSVVPEPQVVEGDVPAKPNTLLISKCGVEGSDAEPARTLFDNGATHSFISKSYLSKLSPWLIEPVGEHCALTLTTAGASTTVSDSRCVRLRVVLAQKPHLIISVVELLSVDSLGPGNLDMVLGIPWFVQNGTKLRVDYTSHRLWLGRHSWLAVASDPDVQAYHRVSAQVVSVPTTSAAARATPPSAARASAPDPPADPPCATTAPPSTPPPTDQSIPSLDEVAFYLISAAQGARAIRKPGMVADMGFVYPRVKGDGSTGEWDIGGVEMVSELPSKGKSADGEDAPVFERGLRFGNSGLDKPDPAMAELVNRFQGTFPSELPDTLPPDRGAPHKIETVPGANPPARPPIRLSQPEYVELQRQLAGLIEHGFVRPSTSPYAAPVFFVKKTGETKMRLVADWRGLNDITIKNKMALPNLEELFDQLREARVFSKLDLISGFNQVRIAEEDIPKTAIITRYGHFEFTVMHFGLTNAPATFQSMMNDVLSKAGLGKWVVVFIDDVLIFSRSRAEHILHLEAVLAALQAAELYCSPKKCVLGATIIKFVGHVFTEGTIAVDPAKTEVLSSWAAPSCVSDVRRFVGFANFFRRFIRNFADMAAPLNALLRKGHLWAWLPLHAQAFDALKQALLSPPTLALPDWSRPFEVTCDASETATSAVLCQDGRLVACMSQSLTSAEANYTADENETLAGVRACKGWKQYLFLPFVMRTDSQVLRHLRTKRGNLSRRQQRWVEVLNDFHFAVVPVKSKENMADPLTHLPVAPVAADASLMPAAAHEPVTVAVDVNAQQQMPHGIGVDPLEALDPPRPSEDVVVEGAQVAACFNSMANAVGAVSWEPRMLDRFRAAYVHDPVATAIKARVIAGTESAYVMRDGLLMVLSADASLMPDRIYVPMCGDLRTAVLSALHDAPLAGHPGRDRMCELARRVVFWPKLVRDIKLFVRSCDLCQRAKPLNARAAAPLQPLNIPMSRWSHQAMDFLTGLPVSEGYDAIFTVVDRGTHRVHFIPCTKSITAPEAAQLYIDNVVRLHGLPLQIVSDRDKLFTSLFWGELTRLLGIELKMSTANHPQTDGASERMHRTLLEMLRVWVSHHQDTWRAQLSMVEFAINDLVNASTGMSAFFADLGYHPSAAFPAVAPGGSVPEHLVAPGGLAQAQAFAQRQRLIFEDVRDAMRAAQLRMHAAGGDPNGQRRAVEIQVGDRVLVSSQALLSPAQRDRPSPKLSFSWQGPFRVSEKISDAAFRLELPGIKAHNVINVSFLRRYIDPSSVPGRVLPPPVPVVGIGGEPEWEVEEIVAHRVSKHVPPRWSFVVKWKGLGVGDNSVEPLLSFVDVEVGQDAVVSDAMLLYANQHADVLAELRRRAFVP